MGKAATSPPPSLGFPPLQSGAGEVRGGPLVGLVAMSPLPSCGSPPLQNGGHNHNLPTCGQSSYVTPALSGIPTASERRAKSEVAHLWAKYLRHPSRLRDPHRFRAGLGGIRCGPLGSKVATSPLPPRGSQALQSGGENQKLPTCGQGGYVTPAIWGITTASERGAKSEVADLWAKWLRHACRLGDPHCCRAGGKIRSGPLVGKVAMSHLVSGIPTTAVCTRNDICIARRLSISCDIPLLSWGPASGAGGGRRVTGPWGQPALSDTPPRAPR